MLILEIPEYCCKNLTCRELSFCFDRHAFPLFPPHLAHLFWFRSVKVYPCLIAGHNTMQKNFSLNMESVQKMHWNHKGRLFLQINEKTPNELRIFRALTHQKWWFECSRSLFLSDTISKMVTHWSLLIILLMAWMFSWVKLVQDHRLWGSFSSLPFWGT